MKSESKINFNAFTSNKSFWIFLFFIVGVTACISLLLFHAEHNKNIAFLKSDKRADWILYEFYLDTVGRAGNFVNLDTAFIRNFNVGTIPPCAKIHFKAFAKYRLWLNDKELPNNGQRNWKEIASLDITRYLKTGTNIIKIDVSRKNGPPVLWLYSEGLRDNIRTDASWMASCCSSPPVSAALANDIKIHPISYELPSPLSAVIKKFPMLAIFFVISSILFLLINSQKLKARLKLSFIFSSPHFVLILSILFWCVLFLNNISQIQVETGFDAPEHLKYIQYVFEKHSIPLANQGWQTYQPPLFYVASAILLSLAKFLLAQVHVLYILKIIPFLCGMGQIYLAFLAGKIIFPQSKISQAISIIAAAIIPMNIYISHYVSNESLCAFLMGLSLVFTMFILNDKKISVKFYYLLGMFIGLALLAKFTVLLIIPPIILILLYKLFIEDRSSFEKLEKTLGVMFLFIILVAGWFYFRNWTSFGNPLIGNWSDDASLRWWQDPGFHSFKYFCRFGKVFSLPYFAGFYSFFDSFYSTFWGDGLMGGISAVISRPPWNYDYMSLVYLLSVPASMLIIIGVIQAFFKAVSGNKFWMLLTTALILIAYSIIYMNLRIPCYGQAKSFYGLFIILPISLILGLEFGILDLWLQKKKLWLFRTVLYGWFGTLCLAVFFSFFIRPAQIPQKFDASALNNKQNLKKMVASITKSIEKEPNDFSNHYNLAFALFSQNKYDEAIDQCRQALKLRPDHPGILNSLALFMMSKPILSEPQIEQAVKYATRSCQVTGYLQADFVGVLAEALAAENNFSQARVFAIRAKNLAETEGKMDLAQQLKKNIELYNAASNDKMRGSLK